MNEFEKKLLRLKNATGITADQDIAAILGMTKAAFSARKTRDAFPDDKVYALAARQPEANIDVDYVLTGDSNAQREFRRRLELIRTVTQKAAALGLPTSYTAGLQEILFFIELQDAAGVLQAIRHLAEIPGTESVEPDSGPAGDAPAAAPRPGKTKRRKERR